MCQRFSLQLAKTQIKRSKRWWGAVVRGGRGPRPILRLMPLAYVRGRDATAAGLCARRNTFHDLVQFEFQ